MTAGTGEERVYEDLRPLLFSIAYRAVGTVAEAEDIEQEAFRRLHRAQSDGVHIESPRAWLSTVTTRLAINHVRLGPCAPGDYEGSWLPEPVPSTSSTARSVAAAST